ncbi:MAG: rRNA pseudouridine synthase [Lachnospiraceae bacterium]|nr:rRNA pseudouridine synthase [Lachnospiraceae bacterium]
MRLDKFLTETGVGTRSQVKGYIKKGQVTVNGNLAKDGSVHIDENKDTVCFQNKPLSYVKERYYMLHKPMGVVCATKDNINKTVLELFDKELQKGLIIVGRLDKDTEGLLFLTTDGEFSHKLMSPKKHVEKTYYFEADGVLMEDDIKKLENGVEIGDDEPITLPAKVSHVQLMDKKVSGRLTITEGRYHQVKRMLQAVGCKVTYLKRFSIGKILLDDSLLPGEYRELSHAELEALGYIKGKDE